MKSFTFTLERTRRYKEQVLNKEKGILQRLLQRKNEIEEQIRQLEIYRELKALEFQREQQKGLEPARLDAYRFYLENVRLQLKQLKIDLRRAEDEAERQRQVVLLASQELSGLDKLEEKQWEEYRYDYAKDNELQLSDHLAVQLSYPNGDRLITKGAL